MFENLKAFIRQGKQANDVKQKRMDVGNPLVTDSNSRNFPHIPNYPSLSSPLTTNPEHLYMVEADPQYHHHHKQNNQQNVVADQHHHEANPRVNGGELQNDGQSQSQSQSQSIQATTTSNDHHYDASKTSHRSKRTAHYDAAATHIVEEENIRKRELAKYPKLENYIVLEQMGEGAFSIVYKAQKRSTGELVAVKILRKFQMDRAQQQAVLKEVTIIRQLDDKNIVKFIEFIESDQYYYIVQELAIGGEIFSAIVNYTYFSEDLARHIIRQVALAIRYLHEEVGIVHRDIKPENILYEPIDVIPSKNPLSKLRSSDDPSTKRDEGEFVPGLGGGGIGLVKIADFGLLKQIWEDNTKTPCGTVGYTAPEIVRDERYSKEVDMWALGCVLYTFLCGFPPFYDERIETLTEKVARGEYTFLAPWWDEISPAAKNCVSRLLTVDPNSRYTIDEFLSDPWMQLGVDVQVPVASAVNSSTNEIPVQSRVHQNPSSSSSSATTLRNGHGSSVGPSTQGGAKYSKKHKLRDLYSPAAHALREAFDISAAVHRMGEEAALSNRFGNVNIANLVEEEEEEEEREHEEIVDKQGHVLRSVQHDEPVRTRQQPDNSHRRAPRFNNEIAQGNGLFDLKLDGATILERRKKQVPVPSV